MNVVKSTNGRNELTPNRSPVATLQNVIDRLFDQAWSGRFPTFEEVPYWPAIDVKEDEKAFTLRADVPGIEAKDLNVEVAGNTLTLSGSRDEEKKEDKNGYAYSECRTGSFSRSVTLPDYVDGSKIEARYDKGVLVLTAPRVVGQGPKRVAVKTA